MDIPEDLEVGPPGGNEWKFKYRQAYDELKRLEKSHQELVREYNELDVDADSLAQLTHSLLRRMSRYDKAPGIRQEDWLGSMRLLKKYQERPPEYERDW